MVVGSPPVEGRVDTGELGDTVAEIEESVGVPCRGVRVACGRVAVTVGSGFMDSVGVLTGTGIGFIW